MILSDREQRLTLIQTIARTLFATLALLFDVLFARVGCARAFLEIDFAPGDGAEVAWPRPSNGGSQNFVKKSSCWL
jgi:hypothetical protein